MADSILDLDPESFALALDELNLPADQRSYLEQQYFEQQRLLPMTPRTEGRRIGSVLPVSWPEGMTGYDALTSGDWEFDVPEMLRGLYEAPAEAMNVGSAMQRGVPVTEQQMADTATTVAAAAVGGGPGIRSLEKGVAEAQKNQARQFFRDTRPVHDPSAASGARFYYPNRSEKQMMKGNPTPTEQLYLEGRKTAQEMLDTGASPEAVQDMTGFVPVPMRSSTGEDWGYRLVAATDQEDFTAFRPSSPNNHEVMFDDTLGPLDYGYFRKKENGGPTDYEIALNPRMSGEEKASTLTHELTHADLLDADIGYNELGASMDEALQDKAQALKVLDAQIANAKTKADKEAFKSVRDKLSKMTSFEMYQRNPGEMLARLSQGDATMAKRLTALQALNPFLRPRASFTRRVADAALTTLLSENSPISRYLDYGFGIKAPHDVHVPVPMDLNEAFVSSPSYIPMNTWDPATPDPFANVSEAPFSDGMDMPF